MKLLCLILLSQLEFDNAFTFNSNVLSKGSVPISSLNAGVVDGGDNAESSISRRDMMGNIGSSISSAMALSFGVGAFPSDALAFSNKISNKYDDKPKRKGPQPKDLGVRTRKDMAGEEYPGLKECGPAPNCFCSTDNIEDDPDHSVPAWIWPASLGSDGRVAAFQQLEDTIKSYTPGQGNIDGGGFEIKTFDAEKGYLYTQFESLKAGYIDDLEFAWVDNLGEREVQVRSSSRVGYLDFGVNAKRLNYIAKILEGKGWAAPGVDFSSHGDYAAQNGLIK